MLGEYLDMAHAMGSLRAWAEAWNSEPEVVYDRLFEGARHALISLDSSMAESDRAAVRPVLDLLTGIKLGEPQPVATAVVDPRPGETPGAADWRLAYPEEFVVLTTAIPRLQVMARPLSRVAVCLARLVDILDSTEVWPPCLFPVLSQTFDLPLSQALLPLSPAPWLTSCGTDSGPQACRSWHRSFSTKGLGVSRTYFRQPRHC